MDAANSVRFSQQQAKYFSLPIKRTALSFYKWNHITLSYSIVACRQIELLSNRAHRNDGELAT